MIPIEVTSDELQVIVQALDTHLRQNGIQVAAVIAILLAKFQKAATENPTTPDFQPS